MTCKQGKGNPAQNPEKQNLERTKSGKAKSRIGQNPEWTKSQIGQNPKRTKSKTEQTSKTDKVRINSVRILTAGL